MGLSDTLRAGIATANSVTSDLQATVTLTPWVGDDAYGAPDHRDQDAIEVDALIEFEPSRGDTGVVRDDEGEVLRVRAAVTILQPVTQSAFVEAVAGDEREGGIDKRDKLTLPDGRSAPILSVRGVVDPSTGETYMSEVILGY